VKAIATQNETNKLNAIKPFWYMYSDKKLSYQNKATKIADKIMKYVAN